MRGIAFKHVRLFDAYADISLEDLISEGLSAARAAWPKYDPKYQPSTFVCTVASRYMISKHRSLLCRRRHEAGSIHEHDSLPEPCIEMDDDEMLEAAESLYEQAQSVLASRGIDQDRNIGPGPKRTYSHAQGIALLALKNRLKLSTRATIHVLATRPEIGRAMRLKRVPSSIQFTRFYRAATYLGLGKKPRANTAANN